MSLPQSKNRLKKIKLKVDKDLSEAYDIGADAQNIDVRNGENLLEVIEKLEKKDADASVKVSEIETNVAETKAAAGRVEVKVKDIEEKSKKHAKVYNTHADMVADNSISAGDKLRTLGYYSVNDGGGAEYYVTATELNPNAYVEPINGVYVELITQKWINVKQLGIKYNDDSFDNTTIINEFLNKNKNGVKLYFPIGIVNCDIVLNGKNTTIFGEATIKGSIELNAKIMEGSNLLSCFNTIKGLSFTKKTNEYAIKLTAGRDFRIENINIDDTFKYGIYYNQNAEFSQIIARGQINNNKINSQNGLYLVDNVTLGCADLTFNDNQLISSVNNVYLRGIDGFKDNNNTYFMTSYTRKSEIKERNFYADKINWLTICNSTFFESGLEGIFLEHFQNVIISNNNIGWSGQRIPSSAIKLGDYDLSNGLYNLTIVSNNNITFPTLNGIDANTNTGRININSNRIQRPGSTQYYYGTIDLNNLNHYGINYPLINENMYCLVTNNSCEDRENNLSSRIFSYDNITNSSITGKPLVTTALNISDTFQNGISTSKQLSYNIPVGYKVNNIRCVNIQPTSHAIQYDINYFTNNLITIKNNYSTSLTTIFTFEIDMIKIK